MGLKRTNVAIPSGDLYPNGITPTALNPDVQATVRPAGQFFRKSPGYETVRPGRTRFQAAYHGLGIHFTPQRFAEDVGEFDSLPLVVDAETSGRHADIAELPGSERLDDGGRLLDEDNATNGGVRLAESNRAAPTGGKVLHAGNRTAIDMGDRDSDRPLTKAFYKGLHNPVQVFRSEYADNPVAAVAVAGLIVGAVYYLTRELESAYKSRNRSGAAAVGAVAAAPVAVSGEAVKDAAVTANRAASAAGEAAKEAASAAGDAAEAAGEAAEEVTDAVADAVTGD